MAQCPTDLDLARSSPFFAAAGEAATGRLIRSGVVRRMAKGTVLFTQGETPSVMRLLLEGSLGLRAEDERGESTLVEIFGPGEVFLAPAAILRLPCLLSGVLLSDSRLFMMPMDAFRDVLDTDPRLARAAYELLARHWRLMVDQVVDLKLRDAGRRVSRFLARRAPEGDADPDGAAHAALPEPRMAIAARLGMTPETLSRTLGLLESRGAIRLGRHGADILDRSGLLGPAPG